MRLLTKPTSRPKVRKPRPDALPPEEPSRTARDARRHRRKIYRRTFFRHSRTLSAARSIEDSRTVFGSRSHSVFQRARGGKLERVHEFSWRGRLQSLALGGDGRDHPARRVSHLVHTLSGGNRAGHATGNFRVSNADVPAHGAGTGERFDVRRIDSDNRGGVDGGAPDGPPARAGGAGGTSGVPRGAEDLCKEFRLVRGGDFVLGKPHS